MKERKKSLEIFLDSCNFIPGGVNSPARAWKGMGVNPLIVKSGKEDTIYDEDDHSYIDYCGSWGSLILGHAPSCITTPVIAQVMQGSSFGIATSVERDLAAKIISSMPSIEKLRFVSSGTEAVMSAIRLARGYTGRSQIIKFNGNYHGHIDALLVQAGSAATELMQKPSTLGIPEEVVKHTISLPFNDIQAFLSAIRSLQDIAAVVIEPIAGNMGLVPATKEFLQVLREETAKVGALLILDEVITGFRVGIGGAQALYGIDPDLTTLGKIIGGGFPAAAFGGKKVIMDHLAPTGNVFQAGTLSGNPVAMMAGLHALIQLEKKGFYEKLQEKTHLLLGPIKEALTKKGLKACVQDQGSMFTLFFGCEKVTCQEDLSSLDKDLFRKFFLYLLNKGVYFSPSPYEVCFVSHAHTKESIEKTRDHALEFIKSI